MKNSDMKISVDVLIHCRELTAKLSRLLRDPCSVAPDVLTVWEEYLEALLDALTVVESVEDNDERLILLQRYLCCHNWPEIAESIERSIPTVMRVHARALAQLRAEGGEPDD